MPATRWGDGWQSEAWARGGRRGAHGLPSLMTAWGTSSLRCVPLLSTGWCARSPSKLWRARPLDALAASGHHAYSALGEV